MHGLHGFQNDSPKRKPFLTGSTGFSGLRANFQFPDGIENASSAARREIVQFQMGQLKHASQIRLTL
jgi:hypothetical protein